MAETATTYENIFKEYGRFHNLNESVGQSIDPYGMFTSILHAQQFWMAHPVDLLGALNVYGKQLQAFQVHSARRLAGIRSDDVVPVHSDDNRFTDPVWKDIAFWDILKEWYLLNTHWAADMMYQTPDLQEKDRNKAAFWARLWLNAVSPTNFFWTNPVAQRKFIESKGESLMRGMSYLARDMREKDILMVDKRPFKVGENVATTPGKVVFRNHILEVLQYEPTTPKVNSVPIVIVAPWINKYYIMDIAPKKSLVKYLVDQGNTVFMTSWKNPDESLKDVAFDDYIVDGVGKLVEVAQSISKSPKVNMVGYCLGGTAVSIYLAWAARKFEQKDNPVASYTLFTGMVDFSNPGEIGVFLDEGVLKELYQRMDQKGFLEGADMAYTFRMLRSNSLIFNYMVGNYLYGEMPMAFDVLYWNTDRTRMPAKMHKYYLQEFYGNNKLIQPDALTIGGEKIDLGRIFQPGYSIGTEDDHIAPWKATFRIANLVGGPLTYTLSTSGHILGIINPPTNPPKRSFWTGLTEKNDNPDTWKARQQMQPNSWWEHWLKWMEPHAGEKVDPPGLGNKTHKALADAPGTYVLETC